MWFRLGILLLSVAVTGPLAQAQDADNRAMELYDNGAVLYDEGRYEDAIVAWEEAYRLSDRAVLLYNIANAEERLGRYQDALDHLNRYRAWATPDERATLDRRITNLERRLEEQAMQDARRRESAPAPAPAAPAVAAAQPTVPVLPPPPRSQVRTAPIALFTIGAVGLAAGGTFGTLAWSARNQAEELCVPAGGSSRCPGAAAPAIVRDQRMSTLADVGYAVGIGGALGGTLALVIPSGRDRMEVTVTHARQGAAVRVAGRF